MFWRRVFQHWFGKQLTSGMFEDHASHSDAQWPSPRELTGRPVGRVLLKMGKVNREQVIEALKYQSVHGGKLGEILVRLGHVKPDDVTAALAAQQGTSAYI